MVENQTAKVAKDKDIKAKLAAKVKKYQARLKLVHGQLAAESTST